MRELTLSQSENGVEPRARETRALDVMYKVSGTARASRAYGQRDMCWREIAVCGGSMRINMSQGAINLVAIHVCTRAHTHKSVFEQITDHIYNANTIHTTPLCVYPYARTYFALFACSNID